MYKHFYLSLKYFSRLRTRAAMQSLNLKIDLIIKNLWNAWQIDSKFLN